MKSPVETSLYIQPDEVAAGEAIGVGVKTCVPLLSFEF